MQLEQKNSHKVPQNHNHVNVSSKGSGLHNQIFIFGTRSSTAESTQTLSQGNQKSSIISNFGIQNTYSRRFIGSRRSVEIKRPTTSITPRLSAGDLTEHSPKPSFWKRRNNKSGVMADEETIEIDTDSLEISLLQASCNPTDSTTTTLQSFSPLSDKSGSGGETGIPVKLSDKSLPTSTNSTIRPSLVRQAKSKHCGSSETSPDLSSNPSSGSIPKRQRTYSSSSSSASSRSSPSTAITWSDLGSNATTSGKVSAHVSAVAAAAKAATSAGRRQHLHSYSKNQGPHQVSNRRLGLPIQRALTLPSSTEESEALLDVSYGDGRSSDMSSTNMKDIRLMMKSPMRMPPPSFPSTIDDENEDYITIEIGEDINSEDKNKLFSDNTLKCEPLKTTDSISNSSTSETLIDIQLSPSHHSEDNSENVFETEESECSKEETDDKNSNICLTSLNSRRHTDSAIQPAIPSIKDENLDNSANNNNSKTTFASIATSRTNADELITTVVEKEQEIGSFEGVKSSSSGKKLIRAETVACCRDASPTSSRRPPSLSYIIPTFTVTINPLEENEVTLPLSASPYKFDKSNVTSSTVERVGGASLNDNMRRSNSSRSKSSAGSYGARSIANTIIIVDDEGNEVVKEDNAERMLSVDSNGEDDELRRCSIGSASSLQGGEDNGNNGNADEDEPSDHMDRLGLGDLGIRRVSDISHINEIRREVDGMEHLASEYYEISREPNPDNISLDSIHKRVLKRCQNKYIPAQRSSTTNKCFVVITTGFTVLGIMYGFWYKNFGPGKNVVYKNI